MNQKSNPLQKPHSPSLSPDVELPPVDLDAASRSGAPDKSRASTEPDTPIKIEYPAELPITAHRDSILDLLAEHQVLVICGETGSGKSTQLPKMLLDAGLGEQGMIGHTQPRRLAARSIATRLAEETQTRLGDAVGYQVRFGDQTSDRTKIKLMTDGILLAETRSDRDLRAYSAIIIDEAHERSLNIDFLLGYLRQLINRRPELKVIITSATIDAERFAEHFGTLDPSQNVDSDDAIVPAPILQVEGRGYPVELRYLPWEDVAGEDAEVDGRHYDLSRHVIGGLDALSRDGSGDTLVFLPTERDIREVSHRVAGHYKRMGLTNRVELLPLYARLPQSQQQAIFHPSGNKRRIIFATNVAESSLTVPGIRYVIDSGTARISRYSARTKVQRLPVEPISRASANQRSGRCGRVGPGICVRLYSVEDFESRDAFTTPEIRRTNLASVVLQSKTLRLGRLDQFPMIDPPRPEAIREGMRTLQELGALDEEQELNDVGWQLGRLPVDPRVGRILIAAKDLGVLPEVLPIAAAMENPDPRDRPPEKKAAADEAHAAFKDPESDFLSLLRLWRFYDAMRSEHSRGKLTRILRKNFLSPARMREWADVYRQLKEMASSIGEGKRRRRRKPKSSDDRGQATDPKAGANSTGRGRSVGKIRYAPLDPAKQANEQPIVDADRYVLVHQALMTGLLSGIAMAGDKNEYTGAGGLKLYLWPGSGIFESKPKWIVAAELVETAKQYARTCAKIQPGWIESVGGHLLKSSYSDPHWSRKSGGAFCYQRQSLFGLPVVVRRRVPLAPIDPATARDLLIRHGLVENELPTTAKSIRHNRRLIESIEKLAAKTRRRDLVVDDYSLLSFYASRLPEDVCDRPRLEKFDRQHATPDWAAKLKDDVGLSAWLAEPPLVESTEQVDLDKTPYLRPEDILSVASVAIAADAYPDELAAGSSRLPLQYHFRPGAEDDGVHLTIHEAALPQVSDDALGWLVPGLLEPKVIAMIKSLPKRLRRNLVPAADVAAKVVAEISEQRGKVPFLPTLCEALTRHAEVRVVASDFQAEKLEPHLEFLVNVVDDSGKVIESTRGVDQVKARLGSRVVDDADVAAAADGPEEDWSREKMTTFDVDVLPREVIRKRGGVQVAQYPGLVDQGDFVSTKLFSEEASAESSTQLGLMRLYAMACKKDLRSQVRHLPALAEAKIKLAPVLPSSIMESALADLIIRVALVESQPGRRVPLVRKRSEFEEQVKMAPQRIGEATQDIAGWLTKLTESYHAMRCQWEEVTSSKLDDVRGEVMNQMEWLVAEDFVAWVPWQHLQHYPRYMKAIAYRLEKASSSASRDAESRQMIGTLWQRWLAGLPEDRRDPKSQRWSEFRWLIEELRVSQFAQPLGTAVKVSEKRCEKLLAT
ncbi:ATP-dependent RNA helicase HrpA [Rhodopirellula halodulae]|uniref:ATP-dependent RNA helicase HrpA n=1 Tax=Rhodopirellula halodulae TaxID=2894198 RepID=UPI001E474B7C|nr:ATP-dependent RNA helicase HrpA [Rhodopirellula sp. JC737]MCC9658894.1 ATP-dependent RNA helicase HrpA [Rhodopirellula sp. JC737]